MDKAYDYKLDKDKDEVTLTVTVSNEKFTDEKAKVFQALSQEVEVKGFRKGKAPKGVVETKLGSDLYEKTINRVLPEVTFAILQEEDLEPMTRINYKVNKVAEGEGVEYEASFFIFPKIKLGDFKKIKIEEHKHEIAEKDITEEEMRLLDIYNKRQQAKQEADAKSEDKKEIKKAEKLTDEIVKELGIGIETVGDLRKQIKMQLENHNRQHEQEHKTQQVLEQAVKLSKIKAPEALIEQEVSKKETDYSKQIENIGLTVEDFLKSQNTSLEDMKKKWSEEARARLETELLLYQVIKDNDIKVNSTEIELQLNSITDEKLREEYSSQQGRNYITSVLLQQKALNWLHQQLPQKEQEKIQGKQPQAEVNEDKK